MARETAWWTIPSCKFDVGTMQCGVNSEPGCLSAAQVQTVRALQQPLRDENGRALDTGLLPGVTVRPGPPSPLLLPFFAEGTHRDPKWDPASIQHREGPRARAQAHARDGRR